MIGIRAAMASVILLMLLNLSIASATTTVTFQPGAYIINMGLVPRIITNANGLKPYGLVYDLVINKQVPVSWAINPGKAKDGVDFTVPSGTGAGSYRGGSFIIPQDYASERSDHPYLLEEHQGRECDRAHDSDLHRSHLRQHHQLSQCSLRSAKRALIIAAFYTPSEVPPAPTVWAAPPTSDPAMTSMPCHMPILINGRL